MVAFDFELCPTLSMWQATIEDQQQQDENLGQFSRNELGVTTVTKDASAEWIAAVGIGWGNVHTKAENHNSNYQA